MNEINTEDLKPSRFYNKAQLHQITGIGRRKLDNLLNGFLFFKINPQNHRLMIKGEWFIEALESPRYNEKKKVEYRNYLQKKMNG